MIAQPYPPSDARREIVFVRHAESQANREGAWNGRTDGELSEAGEESLEPLGRRLSRWHFDAVISSPLQRALRTAEAFSSDVEIDDELTEIDLGKWEGMYHEDVRAQYGDELRRSFTDRDIRMGETGETMNEAATRAIGAVDRIFAKMADGERVAVVTHGGFMQSVLGRHLPGRERRIHAFTANTGITRIIWQYGSPRLASYNDVGHFGPRPASVDDHVSGGSPVLSLIRHGQTRANVERRWQGRGDWDLDELGHRQAETLGEWYGRFPTVYSSPLKRAASTAKRVALNGVVAVEDLMELHMGDWEGMTTEEIADRWADDLEKIYRHGMDLPRGSTGETWEQLTLRFAEAVASLAHAEDGPTLAVAHGGAIRSYVSSLTDTTDTHAQSLYTPRNTAVTHVALTPEGPLLLDYAVATHLESLQ